MSRALFCFPEVPALDHQSGSRRTVHLMEFLLEADWEVTLVTGNPIDQVHARRLRQLGIPVHSEDALADLLPTSGFDVAVMGFWAHALRHIPVVRSGSPRTAIVVDCIDLHFVRRIREEFGPGTGTALGRAENGSVPRFGSEAASEFAGELNAYAAADAVLTVSPREAELLADLTSGSVRTEWVPDAEEATAISRSFAARSGIVFIGNFRHPPNMDSLGFLCEEIVPKLDPDLLARHPISVIGNALEGSALDLCRETPGVTAVGWVPSIFPHLERARVSVVPLRYGAGTKRKLIQSLLIGTPAVSTTIGGEGLDLPPGAGLLVADEPFEFAAAVANLAEDEGQWSRVAGAGREWMLQTHSRPVVRDRFLRVLDEIVEAAPLESNVMKRDWDQRARLDAMHYIASDRADWDEEEFSASGEASTEAHVVSDLERICGGREPGSMRMLEIGCGIGRMTRPLAGVFGEVHGVDVSGEMIERGEGMMKDLPNVFLYETDGSDLVPFSDEFFDFAFSFIVFQHIPRKETIVSNFREVHRTLKPGCLFKFQVQGQPIERTSTWTGAGFDGEELRELGEEIGFRVLASEGEGTQYLWSWWLRDR